MKTRITTVNIRQESDLYAALMYALNSNTDYDGWHVLMYQAYRNSEGLSVWEFLLREDVA